MPKLALSLFSSQPCCLALVRCRTITHARFGCVVGTEPTRYQQKNLGRERYP